MLSPISRSHLALLCTAAISCGFTTAGSVVQSARVPQLRGTQPTDDPTAAAPEPAPVTAPPIDPAHGLVVGADTGLVLWAADGSAHHTLSPGPALHPRRIADDAVLALSAQSGNLHLGAQLVRISLRDGSRALIADLPAFSCGNATPGDSHMLGLDVQDQSDFLLDARAKVACLTLMDRNSNMANLQVQVRVELDTGRTQRWLTVGEPECTAPPGVDSDEPADAQLCEDPAWVAPESTATFPFDFDDDTGWVSNLGDSSAKRANLPEFGRELISRSGRWLVLGGNLQEADYIHRSLVLFDRADGAVYPVLAEPGAWPAPLLPAAADSTITLPDTGMADVVGESDVRWLSVSAESEVLIVDRLVIHPQGPSWAFEGELAH
jgi:hypothetical protein